MKTNQSSVASPSSTLTAKAGESVSDHKVWASQTLLGEAQTAVIEHAGQQYCLRRTKENKLILTK